MTTLAETIAELATEYVHDVICPYCGHVSSDSWELNRGEEGGWDQECYGECGKTFRARRHVLIQYSTEKMPASSDADRAEV